MSIESIGVRGRFSKSLRRGVVGAAAAVVLAAACGQGGGNGAADPPEQADGPAKLVVWTDAVRKPGFEAYQKAHPEVSLDIQEVAKPDDTVAKLQLANRAGEGWPDVVFAGIPELASALAAKPHDFAADLSGLVSSDVIDHFAPGAMEPCTDGERIICLRNDIAPSVLWYDQKLMKKFGYEVPTSWEEFERLGKDVAREHPGNVVGSAAGPADLVYFWPSRCKPVDVTGEKALSSGLKAPACTRVAGMLDGLIDAGSMSKLQVTDPEFIKKFGKPGKLLMAYGPIWYGLSVFKDLYGAPDGRYAMAPPLQWQADGKAWNGNVGGGTYIVSRHSVYQRAAADLVKWMATGDYQKDEATVTFPAYQPQQAGWIERNTAAFSALGGDTQAVLDQAVKTVWPDYDLAYIPGIEYNKVVTPALGGGATVTETLPQWQKTITQEAQAAGWTVEGQ